MKMEWPEMRGSLYEDNVKKAVERGKETRWDIAYGKALFYGYTHDEAGTVAHTASILEEQGIYPSKALELALEIHYYVPGKLV